MIGVVEIDEDKWMDVDFLGGFELNQFSHRQIDHSNGFDLECISRKNDHCTSSISITNQSGMTIFDCGLLKLVESEKDETSWSQSRSLDTKQSVEFGKPFHDTCEINSVSHSGSISPSQPSSESKLVELKPTDPQYLGVKAMLHKTMKSSHIIQISHCENLMLQSSFQKMCRQLSGPTISTADSQNQANEQLFVGPRSGHHYSQEEINDIVHHGFSKKHIQEGDSFVIMLGIMHNEIDCLLK